MKKTEQFLSVFHDNEFYNRKRARCHFISVHIIELIKKSHSVCLIKTFGMSALLGLVIDKYDDTWGTILIHYRSKLLKWFCTGKSVITTNIHCTSLYTTTRQFIDRIYFHRSYHGSWMVLVLLWSSFEGQIGPEKSASHYYR